MARINSVTKRITRTSRTTADEGDQRIEYERDPVTHDWLATFDGEPVVFGARSQADAVAQVWSWKLAQVAAGRLA